MSELSPGQQLGNLSIVELLGKGGVGAVYLGVHRELERRVAIKVLRRQAARAQGEFGSIPTRYAASRRTPRLAGGGGVGGAGGGWMK